MIIPAFWAEARVQKNKNNRQITIRRFGWSDVSQEDAQKMADDRAQKAIETAFESQSLLRREPKMPYNGGNGLPIREEIISRHEHAIITRNSYGALCLNVENVLFADIDFKKGPSCLEQILTWFTLSAIFFVVIKTSISTPFAIKGSLIALFPLAIASAYLSKILWNFYSNTRGGMEAIVRRRIRRFIRRNPDWRVRIYRTPAGIRLLAMHRRFIPSEPAVAHFFSEIQADPLYVRMCTNQNCFRARISPKPWRIGIPQHMKPRHGAWPITPEKIPARTEWVVNYERTAADYAACHFIEELGSSTNDAVAQVVQELHDKFSKAHSELPIA